MRDKVLEQTIANGRINLGLGCYMNSSNPEKEIRTIFNACSQFWSILTLLTINKMHKLIDDCGYTNDIKIVATIYDSIYIHMKEDANLIEWVNNNIIPLLTVDFIKDIIVHNEAEGEIGYDWATTLKVPNNASNVEINNIIDKLKENINDN